MNKKWVEFLLSNSHESQFGGNEYLILPEELINFLMENDLIKK